MSTLQSPVGKLPFDGRPDDIESAARRYENVAMAIKLATIALEKIGDGELGTSEALDEVRDEAKRVAKEIKDARHRYEVTATSLTTYSGQLRTAITDARDAERRYESAETARANAQSTADDYDELSDAGTTDDAANTQRAAYWAGVVEEREGDRAAALRDWNSALTTWDGQARTAADSIDDAVQGSPINDSGWDKFMDVLDRVGEWVSIAALLLSWVPFLGPILGAIALAIAALQLLDSIIKAVNGEGTWADVLFSVLGVALAVVGGRALTFLGKLAKFSTRGGAKRVPFKKLVTASSRPRGVGRKAFKQFKRDRDALTARVQVKEIIKLDGLKQKSLSDVLGDFKYLGNSKENITTILKGGIFTNPATAGLAIYNANNSLNFVGGSVDTLLAPFDVELPITIQGIDGYIKDGLDGTVGEAIRDFERDLRGI